VSGPSGNGGVAPSDASGHDGRPAALLVGFMASGKSVVGRAAAARLGLPFIDTDLLIEAAHGPIPAIFARGGEQLFRELESDVVLDVLSALRTDSRPLVALGGGAVTIAAVRTALASAPLVLWLRAPADVLWERARRAPQGTRPLAEDEAAFRALLAERDALYREVAGAVVLNDGERALDEVVEEVVAVIRSATRALGAARATAAPGTAGEAGAVVDDSATAGATGAADVPQPGAGSERRA
jgi:shikimate kinase